ncbi:MAG: hypothetical protein JXQ69_05890 [Paludibacteraceae bacterium]|nr:hypothetical protein [Paludibacteraceae bacterium]MBN2787842.1 hypothetical protein [Paludibacteraceae bacterium]
MKKLFLLIALLVSLTASAQFKFGAIVGAGIGGDQALPMDTFKVIGGLGPLIEYGGYGYSIRTGAVYQKTITGERNDDYLMVPIQFIIKSSRQGGFVGGGVSLDALGKGKENIGFFDVILGNKIARNMDISLSFSYPFKGNYQDAMLALRFCIFPLSTCKEACGF